MRRPAAGMSSPPERDGSRTGKGIPQGGLSAMEPSPAHANRGGPECANGGTPECANGGGPVCRPPTNQLVRGLSVQILQTGAPQIAQTGVPQFAASRRRAVRSLRTVIMPVKPFPDFLVSPSRERSVSGGERQGRPLRSARCKEGTASSWVDVCAPRATPSDIRIHPCRAGTQPGACQAGSAS